MLTKRIIACLDVADGVVVKGVRFKDHQVMGGIVDLARSYADQGIDELVFYDIKASVRGRRVEAHWVRAVAETIDIPFCVAGGISSVEDAKVILGAGADKVSINTPAQLNPRLIDDLAAAFGCQCVVVGVDVHYSAVDEAPALYRYTGCPEASRRSQQDVTQWLGEVQQRGAGEIVINAMAKDGVRSGFAIDLINQIVEGLQIPTIASGGAGEPVHFAEVFQKTAVTGALAAGGFHRGDFTVPEVKRYLRSQGIPVRLGTREQEHGM